ncbi:hypothetical protein JMJ35_005077 [Cladonia borealis]|uniref:Uncharacterized protein n=1 Tax=Cladonia borealis TaxID=184061 RepID=A0AA39V501_9LECA|nr:hypothetical protein JMJ35_005077 [Cladonia borealis]
MFALSLISFQATSRSSVLLSTCMCHSGYLSRCEQATLQYKDPNLTGCYAGTGGSTTFTLTSGDQLGLPSVASYINVGDHPQTFSMSCSEFFDLSLIPWDLKMSFAESPVCATYAQEPFALQPPGVASGDAHEPFDCCGGCQLMAPQVQILYWSTTSSTGCTQANATINTGLPGSAGAQDSPVPDQSGGPSIAVVDGSTLTYPSLYMAFHGAISVTDQCRQRGNIHYNPTIAIPPDDLSTLSFNKNLVVYDGIAPQTGLYDPGACHTYGLSNGSTTSYLDPDPDSIGLSTWTTSVSYTMGPPYNPILVPPAQLTALDPAWASCTLWWSYGENAYALSYGLYDPPRVLTPTNAMVAPSTTPPSVPPQVTPPAPEPAAFITSVAPESTAAPQLVPNPGPSVDSSPDIAAPDSGLASLILAAFNPDPSAAVNTEDPADYQASVNVNILGYAASNQPIINVDGHSFTADRATQYIIGSQTVSVGSSAIYINGVSSLVIPAATITASVENLDPVLTIDGTHVSADPAGQCVVGSQTLNPGGSSITIAGVPYAIPSSVTAIISAGHTMALLPQDTANAQVLSKLGIVSGSEAQIYTVDGVPINEDPTAIVVDGTTITSGSLPLTVDGQVLSLLSSDTLVVDGSLTVLSSAPPSNLATANNSATEISAAGNGSDIVAYTGGTARMGAGDILIFSAMLIFAHSLALHLLNFGARDL